MKGSHRNDHFNTGTTNYEKRVVSEESKSHQRVDMQARRSPNNEIQATYNLDALKRLEIRNEELSLENQRLLIDLEELRRNLKAYQKGKWTIEKNILISLPDGNIKKALNLFVVCFILVNGDRH